MAGQFIRLQRVFASPAVRKNNGDSVEAGQVMPFGRVPASPAMTNADNTKLRATISKDSASLTAPASLWQEKNRHLVRMSITSWQGSGTNIPGKGPADSNRYKTGTYLTLPYRCSLSDTTLDTMVLHSSLLVAISAHLFMFIPVYRETFPSHPHLFLPRLRLPFTMPSVIIRCRLSCLLTCP